MVDESLTQRGWSTPSFLFLLFLLPRQPRPPSGQRDQHTQSLGHERPDECGNRYCARGGVPLPRLPPDHWFAGCMNPA
ncbi:hypothetical protein LX32DRAFT_634543 [Colletotrichum zoysiae]|uniref:Uncharacterized protein n=1 Tax=Colletotrichum zoysiae TaxID=1216348 RepID=A0AAD9HRZ9_9PEZI|nr:hypothetical protein LX32DRAFT_634543 [Colletotrichum zoysiae]